MLKLVGKLIFSATITVLVFGSTHGVFLNWDESKLVELPACLAKD